MADARYGRDGPQCEVAALSNRDAIRSRRGREVFPERFIDAASGQRNRGACQGRGQKGDGDLRRESCAAGRMFPYIEERLDAQDLRACKEDYQENVGKQNHQRKGYRDRNLLMGRLYAS